jgi:predicted PilT family ATPase
MGVTRFGQAVLGPPGTGKTTYCQGVAAFLQEMGREVAVVNLDPANDSLPYEPEINIAELVNLAVSCVAD